jgi:hypothetical protein
LVGWRVEGLGGVGRDADGAGLCVARAWSWGGYGCVGRVTRTLPHGTLATPPRLQHLHACACMRMSKHACAIVHVHGTRHVATHSCRHAHARAPHGVACSGRRATAPSTSTRRASSPSRPRPAGGLVGLLVVGCSAGLLAQSLAHKKRLLRGRLPPPCHSSTRWSVGRLVGLSLAEGPCSEGALAQGRFLRGLFAPPLPPPLPPCVIVGRSPRGLSGLACSGALRRRQGLHAARSQGPLRGVFLRGLLLPPSTPACPNRRQGLHAARSHEPSAAAYCTAVRAQVRRHVDPVGADVRPRR